MVVYDNLHLKAGKITNTADSFKVRVMIRSGKAPVESGYL
ncbi:hypothetical protein BMS3Abin14_01559 [bacterium BMS3Abin14]|nr:hypothetical protein BMS3Abin14_01559 [bacterium BMS3Abin14]